MFTYTEVISNNGLNQLRLRPAATRGGAPARRGVEPIAEAVREDLPGERQDDWREGIAAPVVHFSGAGAGASPRGAGGVRGCLSSGQSLPSRACSRSGWSPVPVSLIGTRGSGLASGWIRSNALASGAPCPPSGGWIALRVPGVDQLGRPPPRVDHHARPRWITMPAQRGSVCAPRDTQRGP
jgi:hypothetical protein